MSASFRRPAAAADVLRAIRSMKRERRGARSLCQRRSWGLEPRARGATASVESSCRSSIGVTCTTIGSRPRVSDTARYGATGAGQNRCRRGTSTGRSEARLLPSPSLLTTSQPGVTTDARPAGTRQPEANFDGGTYERGIYEARRRIIQSLDQFDPTISRGPQIEAAIELTG